MARLEIMLIASIIAMSCSLVGVFLVIKKLSMISDAISHTVLLGIVIVFLLTKDIASPYMSVGAIIMGLITVQLIETIKNTRLVSEEASIGIVFPFLFSIAIILITRYTGSVHLDTDAVLLGEIAFAPLDRMIVFGLSVPKALVSSIIVLLINVLFVRIFYKELKITTFDAILAATLGFSPLVVNTILMGLVSLTAVSSFNAVGSILVIAFMIGPALSANLLTHDLKKLIVMSLVIANINVILGYQLARFLDVSIAGSMAIMTGITFILAFFFSRESGYLTRKFMIRQQQEKFLQIGILSFIREHENVSNETLEHNFSNQISKLDRVLNDLMRKGFVNHNDLGYYLNNAGEAYLIEEEIHLFER